MENKEFTFNKVNISKKNVDKMLLDEITNSMNRGNTNSILFTLNFDY